MKRYIYLLLLTCPLVVFGKPIIQDDCTVSGNGRVTCSFENVGNTKGAICVKARLTRVFEANKYIYAYQGGEGTTITTADTICSGLVEPMDVRDRVKPLGFYGGKFGLAVPLSEFCKTKDQYSSWYSGCNFSTIKE